MGFYLRCAVAYVDDEAVAAQIADTMRRLFPPIVVVRRFARPFAGVIAGYDPEAARDSLPEADDPGYDVAYETAEGAIEDRMAALSLAFPDRAFAYIDVDCFGGTCTYRGFAIANGARTSVEASSAAHVELLREIGVPDPQWYFAPFTRGWFEHGKDAETGRRPTTCYVHATWREPLIGVALRFIAANWQITLRTPQSVVAVFGEDAYASVNEVAGGIELRLQSFVDRERTLALARAVVDDDGVELSLRDPP